MEEVEIREALEGGMDGWGDWRQIWNLFLLGHLFKLTQDDNGCDHTTNSFSDLTSTHKQNTPDYKYGHVYVLITPNIVCQPFRGALIPLSA